ncbi:phage tail tape measure protein [Hymenobacter sp. ASUV-10]|uniref:Phage tail tape measure protein n=1 Tax=Hymenobacter aranciens TaxID=3063996 RepID=A0ABT9BBA0_9BACT|nr:phage tail tape measure protein [Hymenobacter sp. ASUV-10]MDO7875551.1 phage tail tape measure protein [Hymenobacter sp. ASUV-10]
MATEKEQREVEIVLKAQEANASIKDMAAGVALMNNQLAKMAQDDPRREQLKQDFQELSTRVGAARAELKDMSHTYAEVVLNGQKVSASFNEMEKAAKILEAQLKDLSADDPGRKKMLDDYQALQERIEGVKKEMGQAQEESNVFTQALAFAGVTVGAEAVLEGVMELGQEIMATTKEVETLRSSINTMTGAAGADLDGLTTAVLATSRTFGKEYNEVLAASNTLSKQMGVSQQEAMRLIQQGFLAGADAGGDFLDQMKEYAPQFKAAGYEADQFIGHIANASLGGIFDDKGADVVKEFGLRIREQTKSTTDAMQAAFGSEFTNEIFGGIKNGSMTVQEALQRVSKEMDETKIPANQLQTVIADVFGGPGEDAGLAYLQSLKNVGKGVDEMVDKTNVYTQRQERLLASQTELAEAQNDLTKQLEGSGTAMDTLANQGMTMLYTLLASLAATFDELVQPVKEIWNSFLELGKSMGWVSEKGLTAKGVAQALGDVIHWLMTPTRLFWGLLADITKATVAWAEKSDFARGVLVALTAPIRDMYELLTKAPAYFAGFSAAAESSFGTIGRAWSLVKNREFGAAATEMGDLGKKAGDAFSTAFDQALVAKAKADAADGSSEKKEQPDKRDQDGDGLTDADRAKAEKAAKTARDKAERERKAEALKAAQERLNDLKQWVKDEGQVLEGRNALRDSLDTVAYTDEALRRQQQEKKILDQATAHIDKLTGKEVDYAARVRAIVEARDLQLRELAARFADQDQKDAEQALDEKIKRNEAQLEVDLAQLELLRTQAAEYAARASEEELAKREEKTAQRDADMLEELAHAELQLNNGLVTQQSYDEAIFQAKMAARERELAYTKEKNGEESAEYKKLLAEKLKAQADHTTKAKKTEDDLAKFKGKLVETDKFMNNDNVKFLEESIGKQTVLYKTFQVARKALAIANIGMSLVDEIQQYWATAAGMGPIAGPIYGIGMSGLAVIRSGMAISKVAGFREGGATGDGMVVQRPKMGGLLDVFSAATGMRIGTGGQLTDAQGYEVAGVVHKNEYVIPEWMRADPQVMQVENWLEARRQRGFYEGGPTSEGRRPAVAGDELPRPDQAAGDQRLVQVLESLDQRLRQVEQWPERLDVGLDLIKLDRAQKKLKQVMTNTGVQGQK